ncbi:hypothetical protein J5N97_013002 [Dioscorea zingiberensis]|uniref:C2 domain-containing protein n=1 Tax=Dioscorea zingiberensis TaxID=325984 RepID=A0A9D5CSP5_9LILI|nr:hypothetical protein J5N97_013002 [Dioscorea zingiberensis]
MESLMNRLSSSSFPYKPCSSPEPEPETESEATPLSGILDVYVHEARDIHNICIYANQDVYAKFSLTCSPDEALSTQVIKGGGKNPHFNELLHLTIPHRDAVLKCEIWMLSRARNYLEDQLLGFALVPLSLLMATPDAKLTQDFTLSSTDLFHSPAGTVQLTLSLDTSSSSSDVPSAKPFQGPANSGSTITSEVVLLNPEEYRRIEFPDIGVATENQQMVSEYFDMTVAAAVPFVHLRASSSQSMEDYDMTNNGGSAASPDESFQHSTATSLTDDRNSADSMDNNKKSQELCNISGTDIPSTPTSERDEGA